MRSALPLLVSLSIPTAACGHDWDGYDPRLAGTEGSGAASGSGSPAGAAGGSAATGGGAASTGGSISASASTSTSASAGASGGSGGAMTDCPANGTDQLKDEFDDDTIGPAWVVHFSDPEVEIHETGGTLQFAVMSGMDEKYGDIVSVQSYVFANCSATVRVTEVPSGTGYGGLLVQPSGVFANRLEFSFYQGHLQFVYFLADVGTTVDSAPYVPEHHAFWRLREEDGTIHWETSADGSVYEHHTETPTPIDVASNQLLLFGGATSGSGPTGSTRFDAINP